MLRKGAVGLVTLLWLTASDLIWNQPARIRCWSGIQSLMRKVSSSCTLFPKAINIVDPFCRTKVSSLNTLVTEHWQLSRCNAWEGRVPGTHSKWNCSSIKEGLFELTDSCLADAYTRLSSEKNAPMQVSHLVAAFVAAKRYWAIFDLICQDKGFSSANCWHTERSRSAAKGTMAIWVSLFQTGVSGSHYW